MLLTVSWCWIASVHFDGVLGDRGQQDSCTEMNTSYLLGCCMGLRPAGRGACFVAAVALLSRPQIHILLNLPCAWDRHIGDSFSGGLSLRGGCSLSTLLPLSLLSALPGCPCS